ncbi:MAG: ATP-binding protein [Myxococcota bacterium]|nr:ATP-binding protein [Myxococcota bacterium]
MVRRRDPLLMVAALLFLLASVVGSVEALSWVGRPFPGFLVLGNRVVASAGLTSWPAVRGGEIYQHEVLSAGGIPLASARELQRLVESQPVGTPIEYRLRRGDREITRTIETRVFTALDATLLFGAFFLCGVALCGTALVVRFLRGRERMATGTAVGMWITGAYALTAMDLYGPYRLFRLHALLECFLFVGAIHTSLVFPHPMRLMHRRPHVIWLGYGAAAVLALFLQLGLHRPAAYVAAHRIAVTAFGVSLVALVLRQLHAFWRPPSFEARQRVKVVALGAVAALGLPVVLAGASALSGGQVHENTMGWTAPLFGIAVGYAVLRHDLLGVDTILRRTANYAVLSAVLALGYAGAIAGVELMLPEHTTASRGISAVVFGLVTVALLLPIRDRIQSTLNRVFFRSSYDFRRLVERTSDRLASVADLEVIAEEIELAVAEALAPVWVSLQVRRDDGELRPLEAAPPTPIEREAAERAEQESRPFDLEWGALAIPFKVEGQLTAVLVLGRRLSGRFYGAADRRLLHVLANQGGVAIENALALGRLRELNRDLEHKVRERTSALAEAVEKLRGAQAQLVHQEKMASLGQLVAGIAHEINNPVNFIQGNLHFLRDHSDALVRAVGAYEKAVSDEAPQVAARLAAIREECDLDYVVSDLESVLAACDEGARRTTTLVKDLRTFSHLDRGERSEVDLNEALESTLTLLRSRLAGVVVSKSYGELPRVECLVSQINQVLMNLLANAADATDEQGSITVRTARLGEDRVRVEIEDDGAGIEPEHLDHIFEPFFTTKEVGRGTGLGLAISYGVVSRHSGEIRVRSEPGRGTCFQVDLPVTFTPARDPVTGEGWENLA